LDGLWPKWIQDAGEWISENKDAIVAVVVTAAVVVGATELTVATFGAASVAGVAAISATATIAAKATEVAVLQGRQSENDGKSGGQIAGDIVNSVANNGGRIIEYTPLIKVGTTVGMFGMKNSIVSVGGHYAGFVDFLGSKSIGVVVYSFAALNWYNTLVSIFSDDSAERAKNRK